MTGVRLLTVVLLTLLLFKIISVIFFVLHFTTCNKQTNKQNQNQNQNDVPANRPHGELESRIIYAWESCRSHQGITVCQTWAQIRVLPLTSRVTSVTSQKLCDRSVLVPLKWLARHCPQCCCPDGRDAVSKAPGTERVPSRRRPPRESSRARVRLPAPRTCGDTQAWVGVHASQQVTWPLRLSCAENVYGRRDFTGTVCSLRSAEGLPRATSCHRVGHPAEPAEVRLEPGSVSHQSSRFLLLGPPALSLRHSTLFRPSVFLSQTSPGPPATPHGRISRGNDASAASGSSATFSRHISPQVPTSHESTGGCHSPCLASGVPAFSLALLQFASWIKPGELRRWPIGPATALALGARADMSAAGRVLLQLSGLTPAPTDP